MQRRSSDPSNMCSPPNGETPLISASPVNEMRSRSPAARQTKLISRHSSGGSVPSSPRATQQQVQTKPKHLRNRTTVDFRGRFEVHTDDIAHSCADSSDSLLAAVDDFDSKCNDDAVQSKAKTTEEGENVFVHEGSSSAQMRGRFQITNLDNSPPKNPGGPLLAVPVAANHALGIRRVFSAESIDSGEDHSLMRAVSSPVFGSKDSAEHLSKSMPHTSLKGRFQISEEMLVDTADQPPELTRQPEVLLNSPYHTRSASMSDPTPVEGNRDRYKERTFKSAKTPGVTPKVGFAVESKAMEIPNRTHDILDAFDATDLLAAITRKMLQSEQEKLLLKQEVQRLEQERLLLRQEVAQLKQWLRSSNNATS